MSRISHPTNHLAAKLRIIFNEEEVHKQSF
jgi:hypothetical protein